MIARRGRVCVRGIWGVLDGGIRRSARIDVGCGDRGGVPRIVLLGRSRAPDTLDESFAESGSAARLDREASSFCARWSKGEGHRGQVIVEIPLTGIAVASVRKARDPMRRQGDVCDLFIMNDLADPGTFVVPGFCEAIAVGEREVEIGLFEGQSDGCEKRAGAGFRCFDGGDLTPEIVGMIVAVEASAVIGQACQIEPAMPLFVHQRREQSASQSVGQGGPTQECPGKEFDSHQFMMSEAREASDPVLGLAKLARTWEAIGAAAHAQPGSSFRAIELDCGPTVAVWKEFAALIARRGQLGREVPGLQHGQAEFPNGFSGFWAFAWSTEVWDGHWRLRVGHCLGEALAAASEGQVESRTCFISR